MVWGECLQATPPPPVAEAGQVEVDASETVEPDEKEDDVEPLDVVPSSDVEGEESDIMIAARAAVQHQAYSMKEILKEFPHILHH